MWTLLTQQLNSIMKLHLGKEGLTIPMRSQQGWNCSHINSRLVIKIYDVEYCPKASHDLSKKRVERDVQLYLDTFTGLPKSILCKSCSSSVHVTDSCPLSPMPGPTTPEDQPTPTTSVSTLPKGSTVPELPAFIKLPVQQT